jgi:cytochrome c553
VRNGQWSELMKAVVAQLSDEDMVALAAYTASLAP